MAREVQSRAESARTQAPIPTRWSKSPLSHSLSLGLGYDLRPIIPPAREGRRRKFSEADKRQILQEATLPNARFSEVARRYGIAERVLFRWKQEATQVAAPMFVAVEITDPLSVATHGSQEHAS